MTAPSKGDPTLRWTAATELGPEAHAALCGRGAPYELVTDDVLGARMEVFAARDENLRVVLVERRRASETGRSSCTPMRP